MDAKQELKEILLTLGYRQPNKIIDTVQKVIWDELRKEFVKLLTVDSDTGDARRRDFNQAIFDAERGFAVWNNTDLGMILGKYDQAVKNMKGK